MNLSLFATATLFEATTHFFEQLGIRLNSNTADSLPAKDVLREYYKENLIFNSVTKTYFVGLVDNAIFQTENSSSYTYTEAIKESDKSYEGLMVFALELSKQPTRSELSELTRAFNRISKKMPVAVVFKYGNEIAFATTERIVYQQTWREGEKVGKVSLLKDISINYPHRGHLAILNKLKIQTTGSNAIKSFEQLYFYWQSIFSISILNKVFYGEVIEWFNLAIKDIKIPSENSGSEKHKDFTVRLVARLIFIWFLKELKVVKDELLLPEFDNGDINRLIQPNQNGSAYYKFILQNLFFNALNREQNERDKNGFDVYASAYNDIEKLKELIFYSPYLNGGLFDIHPNDWCNIGVNNGFSVPDYLFLDKEKGLNSILSRYKFTIAENTPLEEEIAVDPEMLGRIFENLLAEQSTDTKEAARNSAGAFYTPRPVVSYMCRNTLMKHLDIEIKPENSKQIIHKLLETTVVDISCGSGAFPMGMLEEMMQVLTTVDPEGKVWVSEMMKSKDEQFREHISEMFADGQIRYIKKLGLLRNCLYGVDLLDYAIEITKLRCWLSLIVEQRVDFSLPNYNLKPLPNLEFKFYKKNSLFRKYKEQNLNDLIEKFDNEKLLSELYKLENEYFITKSSKHGSKEEIKAKIIKLLEKVVESKSDAVTKEYNSAQNTLNSLVSNRAKETEINRAKKKVKSLADELAKLAEFRNSIKDYFIERIVFPGIFNNKIQNPGFDIVIGNPPYVNTKLISSMGISKKLEEEYGFCDDLYNHFTFRGLELLKKGGLLSYITSDTFLTLQTKKNMRMEFLGIPTVVVEGDGLFAEEKNVLPECSVLEIINTPKAFAALVDTAIFCLKKEEVSEKSEIVYVDIRKPNANSFNITETEWQMIRTSKENISGWERILDKTFIALGNNAIWTISHTCDGNNVLKDSNSSLLKFKLPYEPYRQAINYAIFSPTQYNCQILEKIIKPSKAIFDTWWDNIETSREYERNRIVIQNSLKTLKPENIKIIGLLADGGQGMATGNNGRFVGYRSTSRFAKQCSETRILKLWNAIQVEPKIKRKFDLLSDCNNYDAVKEILDDLDEIEIWALFDNIKEKFGLRIFGKGFMYRIIPEPMIFNTTTITENQKLEGIKGIRTYVPYDKGDRDGNRWYLETPYLIDWSEDTVNWLKSQSGHSGAGMPVVRNPQFYFRNGFCWTNVLNPNSTYFKCRLKDTTVNDVGSMSLYDESGLGDKYFVVSLNSYLHFKILREFFNNTVNVQMNDIRKLPIKIPSENELQAFNEKFDACLAIKKEYFAEKIDRKEMNNLLQPIESEIDEMVNRLYGIEAKEEIELEEVEEEVVVDLEAEEEENE